jgi:hypothetical protein
MRWVAFAKADAGAGAGAGAEYCAWLEQQLAKSERTE